jgi:hypothetical protein
MDDDREIKDLSKTNRFILILIFFCKIDTTTTSTFPHLIENYVNLFSPWYSWKIAELVLNNNHSVSHWWIIYSYFIVTHLKGSMLFTK